MIIGERERRGTRVVALLLLMLLLLICFLYSSSRLNSFFSVALRAVTEKAGSSFLAAILVKRDPTLETFFNWGFMNFPLMSLTWTVNSLMSESCLTSLYSK